MEAELRASWVLDVGTGPQRDGVLDELLDRHREPQRHYHTLAHVAHVLRAAAELMTTVPVPDPVAVRLAAWFHDAIYDPRSSSNEADSAALAERLLVGAGVGDDCVAAVTRMVLATAHHEPGADDEAVLVDADLGVLAAEPTAYDAYVHQVRAEYSHLDDQTWQHGRATVLRGFLARPRLFHTAPMRAHEQRARANMAAELHGLDV